MHGQNNTIFSKSSGLKRNFIFPKKEFYRNIFKLPTKRNTNVRSILTMEAADTSGFGRQKAF